MLQQGSVVAGRYEVVGFLGGGGMKQVWLVRDRHLGGRTCALAEMIDSFRGATARLAAETAFKREAELLASLHNDHIPQVYDSFSEGSAHYLVMEYVRGETLDQKLNTAGRLSEQDAVRIALQIAATLQYLHSSSPPVIYRDLKPSNVILEDSGHVVLVDFGIARLFRGPATVTMVGTPGYAAPEQWKGRAEPRSDVYALGALFHQLLSGRDPTLEPPFSFPPLPDLYPGCTREIAALVDDSLRYNLGDRISSIAEFRKRLVAAQRAAAARSAGAHCSLAPTVQIHQTPPPYKHALRWLWFNRNSAIISAVFAGLVGLALWNNLEPKAPKPAPVAEPSAIASSGPSRSRIEASPASVASPSTSEIRVDRPRVELHVKSSATSHRHKAPVIMAEVPPPTTTARRKESRTDDSEGVEEARVGGYFTIGSTKDDVLAVQGTPDRFTDNSFHYRLSSVYFDANGRVASWENYSFKKLRVRMLPEVPSRSSYFTVGSSKNEVLAVQGTPDRFSENSFHYGLSSVYFDSDGRVTGWDNYSYKQLKIRMLPRVASAARYFTIGSSEDDVLAVQGTPDRFTENAFYYGLSSVYFDNTGRVASWENYSYKALNVRMTGRVPNREGP